MIISLVGFIILEFVVFNYENGFDGVVVFDGVDIDVFLLGFFIGNELLGFIIFSGMVIIIVENIDFIINESGFQINYSCQGILNLFGFWIIVVNVEMCDGVCFFGINFMVDVDSWSWDFGDGYIFMEANLEYIFGYNGIYYIEVMICNGEGCEIFEIMIYFNKFIFEIDVLDMVVLGQEVYFYGLIEEVIYWYWDFGNGEIVDYVMLMIIYEELGWYEVQISFINMDVYEICDISYIYFIYVDFNLISISDVVDQDFMVFFNFIIGQFNICGLEVLGDGYEICIYFVVG